MNSNQFKLSSIAALLLASVNSSADVIHLDDVIIAGSACIGFDCVNGESFGFDTLRLKENNLRIRAVDTSSTSDFATNDWQITFNDSANGGANKFSIDDIDGGRTPFTIEAGAPSHSLYVDDGGRLGLGTATPVTDIHVKSGNTPTLRLEQDGSSGFAPQTWDVAGNEAGFFVRDATNGSTLPFRIRPGASSNSLVIDDTDNIGIGTLSPVFPLHIQKNKAGSVNFRIENTGSGQVKFNMKTASTNWTFNNNSSSLKITTGAIPEFELSKSTGNLKIKGSLTSAVNGGATAFPDYVFEPSYKLMPLDKLSAFIETNKHLPEVVTAEDVGENGLNITEHVVVLLKKIEELTLYTIEQDKTLKKQASQIEELSKNSNL